MNQHRIAGRMAERVVDLLETVEVDVKDGNALERIGVLAGQTLKRLVQHPAIAQARQRIVQRIVLDADACLFELGILGVGHRLGGAQLLGHHHVVGHIKRDADQFPAPLRRDMQFADRTNVADSALRQHHAGLVYIGFARADRRVDRR